MGNREITKGLWTRDVVSAFWDYIGHREDLHLDYFANQLGYAVAEFLSHTGRLNPGSVVLDYGCGPGFLIQNLLDKGAECYAADSSIEAVDLSNRKYGSRGNWRGAVRLGDAGTGLPSAHCDVVTCIETLEHLPEELVEPVLAEISRLLKPTGVALFTTPFNEDLRRKTILCPFCSTEYHRVQHQRSFDVAAMTSVLRQHGFEVLFCRGIDLGEFQRDRPAWRHLSYDSLSWLVGRKLKTWLDSSLAGRTFPNGRAFNHLLKPGPHLCAVVRRPQS